MSRTSLTHRRLILVSCRCLTALMLVASVARAADTPKTITLYPQPESRPALAFRLLPRFMQRMPGNAAVHYGKVKAEEMPFFSSKEIRQRYLGWLETPIEQLQGDEIQKLGIRSIYADLRRAAYCDSCDWQLPTRTETPLARMLLSEVQQMREFSQILGAKARAEIAAGDFDQALETLQVGYAAARHTGESEVLLSCLVANIIDHIMSDQVEAWVQQPGAPNLYWALAQLPRPFIPLHDAVEVELAMLARTFVELEDLDAQSRTEAEWERLLVEMVEELPGLFAKDTAVLPTPDELRESCQRRDGATRRALIAYGLDGRRVAEMGVYEAATRFTMLAYEDLHQRGMRAFALPYPLAIESLESAIQAAEADGAELIPLASAMLKTTLPARVNSARRERQRAVLQIFEALRAHAAVTGELPADLDELESTPAPIDPVTGGKFGYRLRGGKAYLTGPPLPNEELDYVIELAPPK